MGVLGLRKIFPFKTTYHKNSQGLKAALSGSVEKVPGARHESIPLNQDLEQFCIQIRSPLNPAIDPYLSLIEDLRAVFLDFE